jgi:hypothetical protein
MMQTAENRSRGDSIADGQLARHLPPDGELAWVISFARLNA